MRQGLLLAAGTLLAGFVVALLWIGLGVLVLLALPVVAAMVLASLVARAVGRPFGLAGRLWRRSGGPAPGATAGASWPGGPSVSAGHQPVGRIIEGEVVEHSRSPRVPRHTDGM